MEWNALARAEGAQMTASDERLKDAFLDMLVQACGEYGPSCSTGSYCTADTVFKGYDSGCLSAYENALDLAVEFGWIKKEEVLR
jgi:hypothetical protein